MCLSETSFRIADYSPKEFLRSRAAGRSRQVLRQSGGFEEHHWAEVVGDS